MFVCLFGFICIELCCSSFDYVNFAVILVCKRLKELVMLLEAPIRGVAPMLTAVRKLQLSAEHLTPLHSEFLLLCLLSRCYKTGLSLLEDGVFEIEHRRDLFLYCYYGCDPCFFPFELMWLFVCVSVLLELWNG